MRKKFFYAMTLVAIAAGFVGCSKSENGGGTKEMNQLSVKLSGVAKSRAVEESGSNAEGTIVLSQGHIFVIDPLGRVIKDVALDVEEAGGTGQLIEDVPADSRVYVLGNIPSGAPAMSDLATFEAIKTGSSAIATQTNYKTVALANSDGLPKAISVVGAGEASVEVSLKPLISRMELVQIKGSANEDGDRIMAFTITGIYLDDYYPSFTYNGGYSGDMFSQGTNTTFEEGSIGDSGTWEATGSPSLSLAAAPENDKVWAHNVASGSLPRLIIRLEGVRYLPFDGEEEIDLNGTHYLTVNSYSGVETFERGNIYRIGAENGISFTPDHLGLTPNPVEVSFHVNVNIIEWEIVLADAELN